MSKKLFFPFSAKYNHLKNYWWHRLIVVIFAITILGTGIFVWQSSLQYEVNGYGNCYKLQVDIYDNSNNPNLDYLNKQLKTGEQLCEINYPTHPLSDFISGLIAVLILFYLLQFIYYKVIIPVFSYVIFGSKTQLK
ncbi:MAG: hypothetical protein KGH93_02425 [Patescibacteria group bacterium]|nr:hypothetical protein [Patescibacteria group bacterium]